VFLLNAPLADGQSVEITPLPINNQTMIAYQESFIREYIRLRNEISPDINDIRKRWSAPDGIVYVQSSRAVYTDFVKTGLWTAFMNDTPPVKFSCSVEFRTPGIVPRGQDTFAANFRWFCQSSESGDTGAEKTGQAPQKDFTIVIKLEQTNMVKWENKQTNPLGLRVSEYRVESGGGDPLNTFNTL
jgi:hypothetical protein